MQPSGQREHPLLVGGEPELLTHPAREDGDSLTVPGAGGVLGLQGGDEGMDGHLVGARPLAVLHHDPAGDEERCRDEEHADHPGPGRQPEHDEEEADHAIPDVCRPDRDEHVEDVPHQGRAVRHTDDDAQQDHVGHGLDDVSNKERSTDVTEQGENPVDLPSPPGWKTTQRHVREPGGQRRQDVHCRVVDTSPQG